MTNNSKVVKPVPIELKPAAPVEGKTSIVDPDADVDESSSLNVVIDIKSTDKLKVKNISKGSVNISSGVVASGKTGEATRAELSTLYNYLEAV